MAREIPYQDGMKLGLGYDLLQGASLPSPAVMGSSSAPPNAEGQQVLQDILKINDLEPSTLL
jgi:hypothetical protein